MSVGSSLEMFSVFSATDCVLLENCFQFKINEAFVKVGNFTHFI